MKWNHVLGAEKVMYFQICQQNLLKSHPLSFGGCTPSCNHHISTLSLNAGICSVLFETRMGCMNEVVPEETQKFIVSVGEMFRLSQIIVLFPQSTWPYVPFWKKFVATWDHLFKVGEQPSLGAEDQRAACLEPAAIWCLAGDAGNVKWMIHFSVQF